MQLLRTVTVTAVSACQAIEMIYMNSRCRLCRLGLVQRYVIIMAFVLIRMGAQHLFMLLKKEIMNAYLFCWLMVPKLIKLEKLVSVGVSRNHLLWVMF